MYEVMKSEFQLRLGQHFNTEQLQIISNALDLTMYNYDVTQKETALTVYDGDGTPPLVDNYLMIKRLEGDQPSTLLNYRRYLVKFFDFCRKPPEQVDSNDIRVFLMKYKMSRPRPIGDRSLDKIREMVCRFFNWASDLGYIQTNPARGVNRIKFTAKQREAMNEDELEEIRYNAETLREKALVEVLFATGCRVSEIVELKISNINLNTNEVKVFRKKNQDEHITYLNAKAKFALIQYLNSRTDSSDYAFICERGEVRPMTKDSVERCIKKIYNKCNISKPVTPHVFRHTTATQGVKHGMAVENMQKVLGHKSINTTMIYAEADNNRVKSEHQRFVI